RALSLLLIVFLGVTCVVYSLVSMWKENRFGWPLRGIIWFTLAIVGSCAVIARLAGMGCSLWRVWADNWPSRVQDVSVILAHDGDQSRTPQCADPSRGCPTRGR